MLKPTVPGIQIPGGNQSDDSPAVITAQTRARILGWAAPEDVQEARAAQSG